MTKEILILRQLNKEKKRQPRPQRIIGITMLLNNIDEKMRLTFEANRIKFFVTFTGNFLEDWKAVIYQGFWSRKGEKWFTKL